MGACRQTYSLWFHLFRRPYGFKWYRRDLWVLFRDLVLHPRRGNWHLFLHDSFSRYLNQFIVCRLFGHRNVQYLFDGGCADDGPRYHCFACEREVSPFDERAQEAGS